MLLLQPEEYEKIGSYAMIGLPEQLYPIRYASPLITFALLASLNRSGRTSIDDMNDVVKHTCPAELRPSESVS